MELYYNRFRRGAKVAGKSVGDTSLTPDEYAKSFRRDFHSWYGRRYYIAPLVGLTIISIVAGWWACQTIWDMIGNQEIESPHGLVAASMAGAFVWIISDELDRLRRRDFTSSDVYYYVFRILLSIPFGWAATRLQPTLQLGKPVALQLGIPVAFFLGAFPTNTLFTAARRIASQQLKLGDDPDSGKLELEALQSIGRVNAERFKDEGISTISQLAYTDPVDLTIRTNFDFNYVLDCVSQALLRIYLQDKMDQIHIFSFRGSQEVSAVVAALSLPNPQAEAQQAINAAATTLGITPQALEMTFMHVAKDPYTMFLVEIWGKA